MKLILGNRKRSRVIFKLIVAAIIIYVVGVLISQQMLIKERSDKIGILVEKLSSQQMKNKQIQNELNSDNESDKEYIEKSARDNLQLARRGERVFMNSAGRK